jgi:hypothetical protein
MGILYKKIILVTLLLISTSVFASVAKVVAFKGEANILREGKIISLNRKSEIFKRDEIKTKENTKIQLLFEDETIISIGKNSTFRVVDYLYDEKNKNYETEFNMLQGVFRIITGKIGKLAPKRFILKTKSASIGIRGTQIVMKLTPNIEKIFCTEGKIFVKKLDSNISSIVNAGEFVSFKTNDAVQKIDVKKIKKNDIKKINKDISIKKNLAADTISANSVKKENVEQNINVQPTKTSSTETSTIVANNENTVTIQKIDSTVTEDTKTTKKEIDKEKKKQEEEEKAAQKEAAKAVQKEAAKKTAETAQTKKTQQEISQEEATQKAKEKEARLALQREQQAQAEKKEAEREAENTSSEEAKLAAVEKAKKAEEKVAKAKADKEAAEQAAREAAGRVAELNSINLFRFTSKDYIKNNNSKVKYSGNFNNYNYNLRSQYIVKYLIPVKIPDNTTISMDIDFGAKKNHISNGKVIISGTTSGYYDTTLEFKGKIQDDKKGQFNLEGENNTVGIGSGRFYGNEANIAKGEIDLQENKAGGIRVTGKFDTFKDGFEEEDFFTIDDITPESYFDDFNSVAKYKGNFNNYSYNNKDQYIQYTKNNKVEIPKDTKISMDVDFGARDNHISNGKIEPGGTSEALTFDGDYNKKNAKFHIDPTGNTKGNRGEGHFYGSEANIMSGKVDFESKNTDLKIKGKFDAKKQ